MTNLKPLTALRVWPDNYNRNDVHKIARSILLYGFNGALRVWRDELVVAGNHTLEALRLLRSLGPEQAAAQLGLANRELAWPPANVEAQGDEWFVPWVDTSHLEWDEAKAFAIADNHLARQATPDAELLAQYLQELVAVDPVLVEAAGYSADELAELLAGLPGEEPAEAPEPAVDRAEELREQWGVEAGQLWEIPSLAVPSRSHRLLCGDSGKREDVERLMAGVAGDLLFTSPPYNVDVAYGAHDDSSRSADEYLGWLQGICALWAEALAPGRAFVWNVGVSARTFPHRHVVMLESLGLEFIRQYVWAKVGVPVPTWHNTRAKRRARHVTSNFTHEMVYVMGRGELDEGGPVAPDDTLEHDVVRINQSQATVDLPEGPGKTGAQSNLERRSFKAHPAAFPVALPAAFIAVYAAPGEVVTEPFCGSGSTIVAAEQLGRLCYGCDIDPKYVAVALDRLERMGLEPRLLEDADA